MLSSPLVILDTNIIFSAMLSSHSGFAAIILTSDSEFFVCESVLVELFKHKEKIIKAGKLSEDEVVRLYYAILRRVSVYKEDLIARENRRAAYSLCHDLDEADTPHVALTLELDGVLWTGDKRLREGLKKEGFDMFYQPAKEA